MLRVTGLKKQFETDRSASVAAVDNVSFEVETGKLLTLLGPSGCGKTTTLRSIAVSKSPMMARSRSDQAWSSPGLGDFLCHRIAGV